MVVDQLSEVFDLVEVRGIISGGFAVRGPWVSRASGIEETLKFLAIVNGRASLTTDGLDGPVQLEAGDVAVLNSRSWLRLEGGSGDGPRREVVPAEDDPVTGLVGADFGTDDVVVGGRIDLNSTGYALLQQSLPPVAHVRTSSATANLRGSLHRLLDEVTSNRAGSSFAIRQHGQLLLLEILRAYVGQTDLPAGWLRILTDDRLRPALTLMHADPSRAFRLEELAQAAAMSRTSFAEHFRETAGVPPLTYLTRWRILLAQRALRTNDTSIGSLAQTLGYTSESAFSTAFKREVGESPLHYRHRARLQPA